MNQQGFTLIELLVTVSILGILAALGVSSFQEYRRDAYQVLLQVETRNLFTSVISYGLDSDDDSDTAYDCYGTNECDTMLADHGWHTSELLRDLMAPDDYISVIYVANGRNPLTIIGPQFFARIAAGDPRVISPNPDEPYPESPVFNNHHVNSCSSYLSGSQCTTYRWRGS